jgi:probable HAF family extracellular repeat protein
MNKSNIVRLTLTFASLFAVTLASGGGAQTAVDVPQAPPQLRYMVIDLGTYAANAITDSGQVVGSKFFGAQRHAACWPNSQSPAIDLGTLPGFITSSAFDINPRGQIVGISPLGTSPRPIFWANSQNAPVELPGLPGGLFGQAFHINSVGQIVGEFFSGDFSVQRAVFWRKSNVSPVYLAGLGDNLPHSLASSINASGNILGDGCDVDFVECHAAFWAGSTSTPVALASPGGQFIYTDIGLVSGFSPGLNNAGSMVGYAYNADFSETRAVFWASSASAAVILSTAGEFINGTAEGISDKGQIVGEAFNSDFSDFHAFMWPSSTSQGIDLNALIPPDSGWELNVARGVNNRGEIAGSGLFNGALHAYVLIPVRGSLEIGVHSRSTTQAGGQ